MRTAFRRAGAVICVPRPKEQATAHTSRGSPAHSGSKDKRTWQSFGMSDGQGGFAAHGLSIVRRPDRLRVRAETAARGCRRAPAGARRTAASMTTTTTAATMEEKQAHCCGDGNERRETKAGARATPLSGSRAHCKTATAGDASQATSTVERLPHTGVL